MITLTLDDVIEIRAIWSIGIRAHRTMQMGVHKKDRGPSADEIHEKHSARLFKIIFSHVDEKVTEDNIRKMLGYDHGEFGHYLSSIYASPNVFITRALIRGAHPGNKEIKRGADEVHLHDRH